MFSDTNLAARERKEKGRDVSKLEREKRKGRKGAER